MRNWLSLLLAFTLSANAGSPVGSWRVDRHVMILNDDGTFYASGYESVDDQYGTYEVKSDTLLFTYTMYNSLMRASYGFSIEDDKLLLFDELGYTTEYTKAQSSQ